MEAGAEARLERALPWQGRQPLAELRQRLPWPQQGLLARRVEGHRRILGRLAEV